MQILPIHYVLCFLGILIYIILSMLKVQRNHPENFSAVVWLKDNWLSVILAIITAIALMLSADELVGEFKMPPNTLKLFSLLIGYGANSIFRMLLNIYSPKNIKLKGKQ